MSRRLSLPLVGLLLLLTAVAAGGRSAPGAAAQAARVTIAGSIVDGALTPLAGVEVALERDARTVARATSDAAGRFHFADVAPGDYRVRVQHAGFPLFLRTLRVTGHASAIQFPIVLTRSEEDHAKAEPEAVAEQMRSAGGQPAPPPATAPASRAGAANDAMARAGRGGRVIDGASASVAESRVQVQSGVSQYGGAGATVTPYPAPMLDPSWYPPSGEQYAHVEPGRFESVRERPLSTFGADVDTASYTNVRRFLQMGQLPPSDAVRIEELINYFRFNYAAPRSGQPIAITTEIGDCPWAPSHKLVLIGARARSSSPREIEGRNIVLLLDVSGSMAPVDRLPLIKSALGMFVDTLRPDDRLAIVTYAGTSGIALPSTPVRERSVIRRAIASLSAGGSTNGGQGLLLAYRVARQAFIPGGVNRVILATDGDFNVGVTSQHDLFRLIERERESGVFLSVFGVGTGNLKDQTMEMLADKGNGHYSYLDSIQEARRVLVRESDSTLETVAKDVKFQVEFNPAVVSRYRLIGYENRALAARDFNNDRKDGGEMGAGHTVTVLYEVVPVGAEGEGRDEGGQDGRDGRDGERPEIDPLRYQPSRESERAAPPRREPQAVLRPAPTGPAANGEWLTVKARFKMPEGQTSELLVHPVRAGGRIQHLPFAAAVADFGLLLRDRSWDVHRWDALVRRVDRLVTPGAMDLDRAGFAELVRTARGVVGVERH